MYGCGACNYDPTAACDDGSCDFLGGVQIQGRCGDALYYMMLQLLVDDQLV